MNRLRLLASITFVLCILVACTTLTALPAPDAQAISAVLAAADRPEADQKRDATRKPEHVLAFFGLAPEMTVLDLFSGGGYYTEAASHVVGPDGKVHSHNNKAFVAYASDEIASRYKDDRLSNVTRLMAENNELSLTPQSYDSILIVLGYHDVYFVDEKNDWPKINRDQLLAELYKGLKPGGVLGVVDHVAEAGAPAEVGTTLHRIDPQRALNDITSAGFVLDQSSNALLNSEDMPDKPMFDPLVRGKTSRFIYRFRRP